MKRISPKLGASGPWVVSVILHTVLGVSVAFLVWTVATERPRGRDTFISFSNPGSGADAVDAAPIEPPVKRDAVKDSTPTPTTAPSNDGGIETIPLAPSDVGNPVASAPAPRETPGYIAAPSLDVGVPPKGAPADAPVDAPKAGGGAVRFAGLGSSNARSVVYVVDGSGPMVTSLPEVLAEVKRSIARLSATQRFGVVVFHGGPGTGASGGAESFMPVLVRATSQAKERVDQWLGTIQPTGRSNPLDGLRAGLKLKPDAIFLLSRGIERSGGGVWDLGLDATLAELDRLNPVDPRNGLRPVLIKTIQFIDEDPTGVMQQIGQQHGVQAGQATAGGSAEPGYRVVKREADLQDAPK